MSTIGSGGSGSPPIKNRKPNIANNKKLINSSNANNANKTEQSSHLFQTSNTTEIPKPKMELMKFKRKLARALMKQAVDIGKAEIKEHKKKLSLCKEQLLEYKKTKNEKVLHQLVKTFITVKSNEIQTANIIMSPDCCGGVILSRVTELKDDILFELMKPVGLPSHESSDKLIQLLESRSIANDEAAKLLKKLLDMCPQVRELGNEINKILFTQNKQID